MAFKPSKRKRRPDAVEPELNLTPIMNLMVVLIPLLLTSAEFVKLGIIELNLPPAAGATMASVTKMPQEMEKKLDLTVTVTDQGFYIASSAAVALGQNGQGPTIPKEADGYDFKKLSDYLYKIKRKADGIFKDSNRIIILAEPSIKYQTVISTMDASRSVEVDGKFKPLFPDVSLGATVL